MSSHRQVPNVVIVLLFVIFLNLNLILMKSTAPLDQKVLQDLLAQRRLIYGIGQHGNDTLSLIVGPSGGPKVPFNPADVVVYNLIASKALKTTTPPKLALIDGRPIKSVWPRLYDAMVAHLLQPNRKLRAFFTKEGTSDKLILLSQDTRQVTSLIYDLTADTVSEPDDRVCKFIEPIVGLSVREPPDSFLGFSLTSGFADFRNGHRLRLFSLSWPDCKQEAVTAIVYPTAKDTKHLLTIDPNLVTGDPKAVKWGWVPWAVLPAISKGKKRLGNPTAIHCGFVDQVQLYIFTDDGQIHVFKRSILGTRGKKTGLATFGYKDFFINGTLAMDAQATKSKTLLILLLGGAIFLALLLCSAGLILFQVYRKKFKKRPEKDLRRGSSKSSKKRSKSRHHSHSRTGVSHQGSRKVSRDNKSLKVKPSKLPARGGSSKQGKVSRKLTRRRVGSKTSTNRKASRFQKLF